MKNLLLPFLSVIILCLVSSSDDQAYLYKNISIPFPMKDIEVKTFEKPVFNIIDYGAIPDDNIRDDSAFYKAISECSNSGGGTVVVPSGNWNTGPLELKSHITFFLKKGSNIIFSDRKEDYLPAVFTRWEGIECYNYHPLIYTKDCENVTITGEGTLTGNGENWWKDRKKQIQTLRELYDKVIKKVPVDKRVMASENKESFLRPSFIQFINCNNISVEHIKIKSGPMWTVHFVYCENVEANDVYIETKGPNNDGIIPDASQNVSIDRCYFSTGDDCVVVKSGLNEDGWRVGKPSKNIVVTNCIMNNGHGGVVVGSEMSGGVENLFVKNCTFNNMETGIRIKSMPGRGGYVRNLWFEDIDMNNIELDAVKISMNYKSSSIEPYNDKPPFFNNISLKNITCIDAGYGITVKGLPDNKVKGLFFDNFHIHSTNGSYLLNAKEITGNNIKLNSDKGIPFVIHNSSDITLNDFIIQASKDTLVSVRGKGTHNLSITNLDSLYSQKQVVFEDNASIKTISLH